MITTFPSLKIDIEKYPAVKQHFMDFGYDRLKQTGEHNSRKKTNNKWFETQDSISYWDDFSKPKIIFQEMVQVPSFFYDNSENFFCLDTGRIITGDNLEFLLAILNSKLFFYAIKNFYGGGALGATGIRMKHTFFEHFPCIEDTKLIATLKEKVKDIIQKRQEYNTTTQLENEIEKIIYDAYNINSIEIQSIENQ